MRKRGPIVLGLLALVVLCALPHPPADAAAAGMRKFYLTKAQFKGNQALTACAKGYHLASIWEVSEPSNLVYNTKLGFRNAAYQPGPPTYTGQPETTGWLDTSLPPDDNYNCQGWTVDSGSVGMTYWLTGPPGIWSWQQIDCGELRPAWCVSNP
jgi:hypothetical protein